FDRFFCYPPMVFTGQSDELIRMAHSAHGEVQPVGHLFVEHPQAVVRVGQTQRAAAPAQDGRRAQHQPLHQRRVVHHPGVGKSGADDEIDVLGGQPVDHPDDVLDAMLTVGVERGEHRSTRLLAGILDAGLDRRALAEVDWMTHRVRACAQRYVAGDARLVEGRDDDPNVAVTRVDANKIQGHPCDTLASAARCTAIPTSGPHSSAITVRVSRPSGSSSKSADATVAETQPTEYARCSAAATAAAPVSVNSAIATAAPVSQANSSP